MSVSSSAAAAVTISTRSESQARIHNATTAATTLLSGVWPIFHTGSSFTFCLRAMACGNHLLDSTEYVKMQSIAGEAPPITHKVESTMALTGYTVATFDGTAQTAFKSGVATQAGVQESAVVITSITTQRRTSLHIAFEIQLASVEAAADIVQTLTAVQAQTLTATPGLVLEPARCLYLDWY